MKVFVAGASGAIGRRLVPLLVAGGHEVTGMTHRVEHARVVADLGARPVVADGLDPDAVRTAVLGSEPEVVIHQMTSLAGITSFKRLDRELAQTNRLRTAGTDNLLESARLAGARRLVAQSFGLLRFAPAWRPMVAENDVPSGNAPEISWETHRAVRHVESTVPRADDLEGVVLRYGFLYGPGTGLAADGSLVDLIRRRQWPIIGDGAGTWSFVHVDDAAAAAVAALDGGSSGVYNVADDEPAPVAVWLPELAAVLGAKPPRRVPEWFGRLAAGEWAVYLSTGVRGLLNAKAKRGLAWQPFHPSWRRGFRDVLGEMPAELVASAAASG